MQVPLCELMRRRGLQRAEQFDRIAWQTTFSAAIEEILHAAPRTRRFAIAIEPQKDRCVATVTGRSVLVPVRLTNQGTHAAVANGPARTVILCRTVSLEDRADVAESTNDLPDLLMPGQSRSAMLAIATPGRPGNYEVQFWACEALEQNAEERNAPSVGSMQLQMVLEAAEDAGCNTLLTEVQHTLAATSGQAELPVDYLDVTEGRLAALKRWIKAKLLGNFKHAYVDVLSRRQTQVNVQLITAVQRLTDCCETLNHAVQQMQKRLDALEASQLASALPADKSQTFRGKSAARDEVVP